MIYVLLYLYFSGAFLFSASENEQDQTLIKKTLYVLIWPIMVTIWFFQGVGEGVMSSLSGKTHK